MAGTKQVEAEEPHPCPWMLTVGVQDQDLDWVCKRRLRAEPEPVLQAAQHLYTRTVVHGDKLHSPDAWFHLKSRALVFEDPGPGAAGFVGLSPGDSLHSSHVMRVSFLYHDMVYVGLGYVVGFNRVDNWMAGEIALNRLDKFHFFRESRIVVNHFPRYMARDRVVQRALTTIGFYTYDPVKFNCQHVYHAIMGNEPHSLGAEKLFTLTFASMVLLVAVIVVVAMVVIRYRKRTRGK